MNYCKSYSFLRRYCSIDFATASDFTVSKFFMIARGLTTFAIRLQQTSLFLILPTTYGASRFWDFQDGKLARYA
jgi:hypothetical protein